MIKEVQENGKEVMESRKEAPCWTGTPALDLPWKCALFVVVCRSIYWVACSSEYSQICIVSVIYLLEVWVSWQIQSNSPSSVHQRQDQGDLP